MGDNMVAHESADTASTIHSSNTHLGDILPDHARENILPVARKFFGQLNVASTYFTKERINYRCSVNMQMGGLAIKRAQARNNDMYLTFSAALRQMAKQLRRTKREFRGDKGECINKDVVLRERINPAPGADEDLLYAAG
jgi:ribosomal subunit interface protein